MVGWLNPSFLPAPPSVPSRAIARKMRRSLHSTVTPQTFSNEYHTRLLISFKIVSHHIPFERNGDLPCA
ncbi:hypothetical protein, partial [Bradyrhizobium sp.]|uniref:hypothetical protein n=1 Tax=Bradyrhizobium sp. TaxID=376 RepID=UPI00271BDFB0